MRKRYSILYTFPQKREGICSNLRFLSYTLQAPTALLIGAIAGGLCVFGYSVVQANIKNVFKIVDTCGVHNLHGMPGIFGGVAAMVLIPGIAKAEAIGIVFTLAIALVGGLVAGFLIRAAGDKKNIYDDREEFIQTEEKGVETETASAPAGQRQPSPTT